MATAAAVARGAGARAVAALRSGCRTAARGRSRAGPARPLCTAPGTAPDMKRYLRERYREAKRSTAELVPSIMSNLLNPDAIFSNNEMSLSDIEIYGFDYDYTLVFYSKHLHTLIFNAARDLLINEHRYPAEIRKYEYDPNFAIRGLHYDVQRTGRFLNEELSKQTFQKHTGCFFVYDNLMLIGFIMTPGIFIKYANCCALVTCVCACVFLKAVLMKIDAFHYIQLGTVYRNIDQATTMLDANGLACEDVFKELGIGLSVVPDEEVIEMYEGSHVPLEQMSDFYGKSSHGNTMKQFMDIFSLPEMTLLSCVNEYFLKNNIDYEPVHLYKDVKDSIRDVHTKGIMYRAIEADIEKYICYPEQTRAVLAKLADHGKKMFLITNSPSSFVDKGMRYIVGKDWRDLFDVVIVQAEKPNFFNDKRREMTKGSFNTQFGSLFRTDQNPTYFLRRLSRFADIYMASLSCLLSYDVSHTFYPRRTPLQHELPAWSDRPPAARLPLLQEAQAK
eukprot:bmy_04801T0